MSTTTRDSCETVALGFVELYYQVLYKFSDQTYKFYKEESVLSWALPNGEIKSATTSRGINEFIMSSHFKDNKVEIITIDSQSSVAGGILVVITACLIGQDKSRKSFSQTFFLAPQEKGYYVLNDIFRFISEEKSSTIVVEKVDENASIPPLAIVSKDEAIIEENSDKSETKVTTDDQIGKKPSLTSREKGKSLVETASVVQNEDPKVSYASMMKHDESSSPTNAPCKNISVVADDGLLSTPEKPQDSGLVQALTSSSSGVLKVVAPSTNVVQDNFYDDIQYKSIHIGGLPINTTRSDLYAIVKEFGPVHFHDVQVKAYENGYCCGFVHFQDEASAQNAVQTRRIIVKGREVYMRYKRLNKGRVERANFSSDRGGFRNGGSELRRRPQYFDGHRREGYQQQNYRRRDTNYNY